MKRIRAIIVDDEERGIIALKQLALKHCDDLDIVGEATSIGNAVDIITLVHPDVVFLDIEMPGGNGFQLLERFDKIRFDIIFVTAYQEYALKAIKSSALDYLLKPVKLSELKVAVERAKNRRIDRDVEQYDVLKNTLVHGKPLSRIILSTSEGYYPVKMDDIIYCRASDSYTHFYLSGGKHYLVCKNLKETEEMLSPQLFYRIHKSYLINLDHIEKIGKADGICVVMSNGEELPVSFRKKDEFLDAIRHMQLMP